MQAAFGAVTPSSGNVKLVDQRTNRVSVVVRNDGSNQVYLGGSDQVTTANGYPLLADEELEFPDYQGPLWVAVGAASDVRFFEVF